MDDINLEHSVKSTAHGDKKNDIVGSKYSFKKKKPLPGAYPKKFSPYLLEYNSTTRVVPLPRLEIRRDLIEIHDAMAKEFSSHYFDEVGTAPTNEHNIEGTCQKPSVPMIIQRRIPRRSDFCSIPVPMTEAEERRQLRAALKASQIESGGMVDENGCSKMRMMDKGRGIVVAKQEASDAALSMVRIVRTS
jgi:hypothetical protein